MNYDTSTGIVVLYDTKEYKSLDKKSGSQLSTACKMKKFDDNNDTSVTISYPSKINVDSITVVKTSATTAQEWREFGGTQAKAHKGNVDNLVFDIDGDNEQIYEGAMLGLYSFDKYKTVNKDTKTLNVQIDAVVDVSIHDSIYFARDLITEPGNVLYPASYAQRINDELTPLGVNVRILHQSQLESLGFDLLLSVGQGSTKDSYVVVMEWMNGDDERPLALVGKGVTFDTGGISIKPSAGMGDMKYDMGGSGAVVGAMHAIASQNVEHNIVGIVGLVENMPDGNAIKPGDVVTSLSGQTVENLNTDAEGRLVLGDILTFVQNEYNPDRIIDLATLTGAIVVSLASESAGLFTNSTSWSNTIIEAGKRSGESFWRMPMGKNWNKMIDSDIADMKNISSGRGGGSTTAAEFLYRFVNKECTWAHLDIAGVCWNGKGNPNVPGGAVGFGVRTLFDIAQQGSSENTIDEDMKY